MQVLILIDLLGIFGTVANKKVVKEWLKRFDYDGIGPSGVRVGMVHPRNIF